MTSPVPQAGKNEEGLHAKPFTSYAGRLCRRIPTLGLRDRAGRASEFVIGGWQWEEPRLRGISDPPEDYRRSLLLMIAVIGCMFYACNYDLTWQRLSWRHWASRMHNYNIEIPLVYCSRKTVSRVIVMMMSRGDSAPGRSGEGVSRVRPALPS